jgi:hypothetical protein
MNTGRSMRDLIDRRENILRMLRRHKDQLRHLDLAKRTQDEVLLWLVAHSTSLENSKQDLLGLWYGFGSLYCTATIANPGEALRGAEICTLLGDTAPWSKYVRIRDQLIYQFALQLRIQAPSMSTGGIYCYMQPVTDSRNQIKVRGVKKRVHTQRVLPLIALSSVFAQSVSY